jgi:hypothetical protein
MYRRSIHATATMLMVKIVEKMQCVMTMNLSVEADIDGSGGLSASVRANIVGLRGEAVLKVVRAC